MGLSGKLEAIILKHKNIRDEEIIKSVGKLLQVYVYVATMRSLMQFLILSYTREEEMESASERIKKYMENDSRRRVVFLTRILKPSHENAIFLAWFNITDFPIISGFMQIHRSYTNGEQFAWETSSFLANKKIALQPVVFENCWMNAASMEFVWSTSSDPLKDSAKFCFEPAGGEKNIFFIKSLYNESYIYMKTNLFLSQMITRPKEEGMFKLCRLQNGNCLISVVKYPFKFLYMQNSIAGRIKGAVSDATYANGLPTGQHEWSLKEVCHRNADVNLIGMFRRTIREF
jgi:hypothetical protein